MSENFKRWKELAALCLREQDPAKLAQLATEMNLVLAGKIPIDPVRDAPESVARKGVKDAWNNTDSNPHHGATWSSPKLEPQ
jgi:hypothetical protein